MALKETDGRLKTNRVRTVVKTEPRPVYFIDCGDTVRVGRKDWPGDCFEVVSPEDFAAFKTVAERLNLLEDITDSDD